VIPSPQADEIAYRLATLADAEQLAALRWAHVAEETELDAGGRDEFARRFCAFLERGLGVQYACWVAESGGRIVAHIYVGLLDKVPRPGGGATRIGYVTNVHTVAECRNQGIGSRLMEQVQGWARRHEFELLFVWPSERSVPYYRRLGFTGENEIMECVL
jgi:GNAT superfamily N-acetyltransferase